MTTKVPSRQITSGAATSGQVLTADGVGGVSFATPPSFPSTLVRKSATQAVGNVNVVVPFDVEVYDDSNWHNNSTNNSRITVDYTGRVNLQVNLFGSTSAAAYSLVQIFKNGGTQVAVSDSYISGITGAHGVSMSVDTECTSGDYFEVFALYYATWVLQTGSSFSARKI